MLLLSKTINRSTVSVYPNHSNAIKDELTFFDQLLKKTQTKTWNIIHVKFTFTQLITGEQKSTQTVTYNIGWAV